MNDSIFICKIHNTRKKWIGGEPAREENLYCIECDLEENKLVKPMNTNETMIERVGKAIRYTRDCPVSGTDNTEVQAQAAINETIQCLVEKSANADLVFSGGNEEYESNTTKWLKEQLTDKEVGR